MKRFKYKTNDLYAFGHGTVLADDILSAINQIKKDLPYVEIIAIMEENYFFDKVI